MRAEGWMKERMKEGQMRGGGRKESQRKQVKERGGGSEGQRE